MSSKVKMMTMILAMLACSCAREKESISDHGREEVVFDIGAEAMETKSILSSSIENEINSVIIAAYNSSDGNLDATASFSKYESLSLKLDSGKDHDIYVLVNMALAKIPQTEREIMSLEYPLSSYQYISKRGLPMAGVLYDMKAGTRSVRIKVERLVAKILLDIDFSDLYNDNDRLEAEYKSDKFSMMKSFSIYARQCNGRLTPFGQSKATSESSLLGDEECDLYFEKNGEAVMYVPENMQGSLLSGNRKESGKTPEGLSGAGNGKYSSLCSYIEVDCTQDIAEYGVGGNLAYKFYIGNDSSSDFSVERNKIYRLTLKLTRNGQDEGTWRVTKSDWNDSRSLDFENESYTVKSAGDEAAVKIIYCFNGVRKTTEDIGGGSASAVNGTDWKLSVLNGGKWKLVEDCTTFLASKGLSCSFDWTSDTFLFSTSSSAVPGTEIQLSVESFDGLLSKQAVLKILEDESIEIIWKDSQKPAYIAQKGLLKTGSGSASFSLSEGSDKVLRIKDNGDGTCYVSAIGKGTGTIQVKSSSGKISEEKLTIEAPVLKIGSDSYSLLVCGTEDKVSAAYYGTDGNILSETDFDPDLYEELLKPSYGPGTSGLAAFLGTEGDNLFVARLNNDGSSISSWYGKTVESSVMAWAPSSDVSADYAAAVVVMPFSGSSTCFGTIDNLVPFAAVTGYSAGAFNVQGTSNASTTIEAGKYLSISSGQDLGKVGDAGSVKIESGSGLVGSMDKDGNLSCTFGNGTVGKTPVKASVKNSHSGEYTEGIEIGYLKVYLHTAVGGVLSLSGSTIGVVCENFSGESGTAWSKTIRSEALDIEECFSSSSSYVQNQINTRCWCLVQNAKDFASRSDLNAISYPYFMIMSMGTGYNMQLYHILNFNDKSYWQSTKDYASRYSPVCSIKSTGGTKVEESSSTGSKIWYYAYNGETDSDWHNRGYIVIHRIEDLYPSSKGWIQVN